MTGQYIDCRIKCPAAPRASCAGEKGPKRPSPVWEANQAAVGAICSHGGYTVIDGMCRRLHR